MNNTKIDRTRIRVTAAGALINFSLGIFYAWSVFAEGLIKELGWSKAEAMLPYTIELLVYSFAMILGGRFQDRFGPRRGILLSGVFGGMGLILCALTASPAGIAFSFGVIFGAAAAFGYSAVTPAVIRWFPPSKRGSVIGFVLMSLGAAALVCSPLVNLLTVKYGVINTFMICGIFIILIINGAGMAVTVPPGDKTLNAPTGENSCRTGIAWFSTLRRPSFKILWLMIGLSSGVGIMFVGHLVQIAELNFQVSWGYLLVSVFAATNAAGRLGGGILFDRIGYIGNIKVSLFMMLAAMMLFLSGFGWPALVAATFLLGLSYGSMFTSFPTLVGAIYGLENFGLHYGMIFTSVGIVGGLGPLLAAFMAERTGSYNLIFIIGLIAALFSFYLLVLLKSSISSPEK